MRYRWRRIRKPQVFAVLMIASAVFVLLPREYTGPARSLVQLMASLPQRGSSAATHAFEREVNKVGAKPVSREEQDSLRRENVGLTNANLVLRQQLSELQATVSSLGQIKSDLKKGTLIPASVLALDAAGGRESLLLGKGRMSDLKKGDWVASRLLIDAGAEGGIKDQSAVVAFGQLPYESLIGWIEDVSPLNARVVLLSDPVASRNLSVSFLPPRNVQRPVLRENGQCVRFTLEGAGNGRMRVLDIFHDYVEKNQLMVGDYVASQQSPRLPAPLIVGRVEKFERVKQKPVYFTAIVVPVVDPRSLDQVFVIDASRPTK